MSDEVSEIVESLRNAASNGSVVPVGSGKIKKMCDELERLSGLRQRLVSAIGACRNDCEMVRLEAILNDQ